MSTYGRWMEEFERNWRGIREIPKKIKRKGEGYVAATPSLYSFFLFRVLPPPSAPVLFVQPPPPILQAHLIHFLFPCHVSSSPLILSFLSNMAFNSFLFSSTCPPLQWHSLAHMQPFYPINSAAHMNPPHNVIFFIRITLSFLRFANNGLFL